LVILDHMSVYVGVSFLVDLILVNVSSYVFIYIYWCPIRFPYHITYVSFYTNRTGVNSGACIDSPSEELEFTSIVVEVVLLNP